MFAKIDAVSKDEIFLPLSGRRSRGVYFFRIADYSESIRDFLWSVHEAARQRGVIIEGKIGNPDERQLRYYTDILGNAFRPGPDFVSAALQKWIPRMGSRTRGEFTSALCARLDEMRRTGKNENIQKNVYIKMMCWLYYRFERLSPFLGEDNPPKILYEAAGVTDHEFTFLKMLSSLGADIVLLETREDVCARLDPGSQWSQRIREDGSRPFPPDFSLQKLHEDVTISF